MVIPGRLRPDGIVPVEHAAAQAEQPVLPAVVWSSPPSPGKGFQRAGRPYSITYQSLVAAGAEKGNDYTESRGSNAAYPRVHLSGASGRFAPLSWQAHSI